MSVAVEKAWIDTRAASRLRLWSWIRSNLSLLIGSCLILVFILMGAMAPLIAPYDPLMQHLNSRMAPGFWAGNHEFLLGTDELGRDLLSRMIYGTRTSLLVGTAAVAISLIIGSALGLIAGYSGGVIDILLMRVVDVLLSFPYIILAIALLAIIGNGILNAVIAVGVVLIPSMARVARGVTLALKDSQFVEAAKSVGASQTRILLKHILPNLIPQLTVLGALSMGETILYIAALGFLGLGIQPPTPEWGAMISTGKDMLILGKWWLSLFPGLALTAVVMGFVLAGEGLRDLIDPRLRK